MINYRISLLAQNDLRNIWDYTAKVWSTSQAEKYIDGLVASFNAIADGRTKGKSSNYIRQDYKRVVYGQHIIFFRHGSDSMTEIIRILHSSMDIENRLLEN